MASAALDYRVVWPLGLGQLINWGVSFYLLGAFGQAMIGDLGWSAPQVFAGLSVAMVVMGLVSPLTGRLIERFGGRNVLQLGTLINALGCVLLAFCDSPVAYYLIWLLLGIGMRLSLYDALFATLAGLAGERARPAMVRITLLGGLSSAVFWPLGHALQENLGWRSGALIYAALAIVSAGLLFVLPKGGAVIGTDFQAKSEHEDIPAPLSRQILYGLSVTLIGVLSAGLGPQLPGLLAGMGAPISLVALWGIGQTSARLTQSLFGRSTSALSLNLLVSVGLPLCFALGLMAQGRVMLACLFVFGYGALNGLSTLLRASLPFELFAHRQYARLLGRLVAPGFILSAFAPWFFAAVRDHSGDRALLGLAMGIGIASLVVALLLRRFGMQCKGLGHGQPQQHEGQRGNRGQREERGAVTGFANHQPGQAVAQRRAQAEHR